MYVYHYPLPCMSLTCILDPNLYVCKYNITWLILPTKLLHHVTIDINGESSWLILKWYKTFRYYKDEVTYGFELYGWREAVEL